MVLRRPRLLAKSGEKHAGENRELKSECRCLMGRDLDRDFDKVPTHSRHPHYPAPGSPPRSPPLPVLASADAPDHTHVALELAFAYRQLASTPSPAHLGF
jgi:hypothetical protein